MNKLLLDLPEQILTDRLHLRPYRAGDGPAYHEVCLHNKAHLLPFEAGNPALNINTVEEAETLVRRFAVDWLARDAFFLGGWHRASGRFICQVYVGPVDWNLPEFEIGYFVDTRHKGQGYVTEAVRAVVQTCFDHLDAHRLRLSCNELNVASWRVAERCGFVREGHLRQRHPAILCEDGVYSGDYLYGLLRSEFHP
jgi:RimJ/RimL family protein N-acetyltransferase